MVTEERILAFADGRLSETEAAEVERDIAADPEAAALYDTLKSSDLPLRDAVEAHSPVPDLSGLTASIRAAGTQQRAKKSTRMWHQSVGAMAATVAIFLAAGVLIGHYALPPASETASAEAPLSKWDNWIDRIANYQALYTRETLAATRPPAAPELAAARQVIDRTIGAAVPVPDLGDAGAELRLARVLSLGKAKVAQIEYLPADGGAPFALCIMKFERAKKDLTISERRGLQVAAWSEGDLSFILVGEMTPERARALAEAAQRKIQG